MFIGENPGKVETDLGRPAIGPTGKILRRLVKLLNGDSEEGIAYSNVVRCRPMQKDGKDRNPTEQEIGCCKQFVLRDIERLNPQYIVLLGNAATFGLALEPRSGNAAAGQEIGGVMRLRGLDYEVRLPSGKKIPAVVTYNFAYVSRNPTAAGVWREDIEKVFWRLRSDYQASYFADRGKPAVVIKTIPKLKKLLHKMRYGLTKDDVVALDYETDSVSRLHAKVLCVGFSYRPDRGYVIPMEHKETPWSGKELKKAKKLLAGFFSAEDVSFGTLIAHNLKFEASVTQQYFGVSLCHMPTDCTMLRAHALNENRKALKGKAFGLKDLVEEWMQFYHYHDSDIEPTVNLRNKGDLAKASLLSLCEYNAMDCYAELRLFRFEEFYARTQKRSSSLKKLGLNLLGPASVFAAKLEADGIRADKEQLRFLMSPKSPILKRMAEIEQEMYALPSCKKTNRLLLKEESTATSSMKSLWSSTEVARPWVFNLRKPKAKSLLFLKVLGLKPLSFTKKGNPQIDDKFYETYKGVKEVDLFAQWQDYEKLRSTYVDGIYKRLQNDPDMRDGRVRGKLNLGITLTSRTSFEDPNMQNIPKGKTEDAKGIKRLYISEPGRVLVCFDYSQAEVRWFAETSKDRKLIREFKQVARIIEETEANPTPENAIRRKVEGDFHVRTASQVFKVPPKDVTKKQRGVSKNIVFGNIYGMGIKLLSQTIECSRQEAIDFQNQFFSQFQDGNEWLTKIEEFGFRNGYVDSPIGRRRHLTANFLVDPTLKRKQQPYKKEKVEGDDIERIRAYEKRASRNSPIQSVASDTNLMACIALLRYIVDNKKNWWIVNVVHDSIIADIPFEEVVEYERVARKIMQSPRLFSAFGITPKVPFIVDCSVGLNWGDQFDVTPLKTWEVKCKGLGKDGKPCKGGEVFGDRPDACPSCGNSHITSELTGAPLKILLKKLARENPGLSS